MKKEPVEEKVRPQKKQPRRHRQRYFLPLLMLAAVLLCLTAAAGAYALFGGDDQTTPAAAANTEQPKDEETKSGGDSGDTDPGSVDADPDGGYGQLVNRTYPIQNSETYAPDDLVAVSHAYNGNTQQMRKEAAAALEAMLTAFETEYPDLPIYTKSGYRTYALQNTYYQNQIKVYGSAYEAATHSAVPGTSEHELGLAVDLSTDGTLTASFEGTAQGQWFLEHCSEYGFIHRYPRGSELVTGIIYEPWHFRYVGAAIAADIADQGVATLEEYYGLYLEDEDLQGYEEFLR